ncbi:hypothetical protein SL053_000379 [Flavobacterium psychrophilum]|uniref:Uncharacterized protein n=2 Tax=Flavobacterium psychrophilum TaxID=96345 RepID=A0A7U2NGI6_FLAPS|nr:hypothetical protein [Flavobacterium psychrophilum]EKT3962928.1 hypothetical protein [Flavobacterium psychrophilum]EKT4516261.1 hypothetical protein [Flavobacterium psychrophilum]ELM3643804.1 hypothetical protein [Flavobacterium psychrophilum]ELY2016510.1 hypothetical protein [Flavobacterium psychrophilum]OAE92407.1 hypothetical protein SU65_05760 [Flavobacterium psychrophilum]
MSNATIDLLDKHLKRKTLKALSLNDNHTKHQLSVEHLINSDKECFDFDNFDKKNCTVDALEFSLDTYYLIEFKDERVYNFSHNWQKTMEIISKVFQSINEIIKLYLKNNISKIEFYSKKIEVVVVFSSLKSTDFNDFKTLQTILTEKYGNFFEIDILNEKMFIEDYLNTNKVGI